MLVILPANTYCPQYYHAHNGHQETRDLLFLGFPCRHTASVSTEGLLTSSCSMTFVLKRPGHIPWV
jgi:hypothetical protein